MIGQLQNLNWISVLVAFVPYFLLGALWFTLVSSKPYRKFSGEENETLTNSAIFIAGPALCSLVITFATALLIHILQIHSVENAAELSIIIGIDYLVANTFNIAINPNIPRPILYGIISGTYHLTGIMVVCIILAAMK